MDDFPKSQNNTANIWQLMRSYSRMHVCRTTAEISDCYYNLLFRAILKLINLLFRDFAVRAHYEYTRLVYGLSFGTAIFSIWEEMIFSYAAFFANFN